MIGSRKRFRIPVSALVALSVAITFTLSSFAAPGVAAPSPAAGPYEETVLPVQAQAAQTGVLTATGSVTVNGNPAATGMTILTGSVIQTGVGGHAVIELGPLGRTELGQLTTITLQMLGNVQESALTQCGDVTVTVPIGITGRVTIPQPRTATVRVSEGKVTVKYDNNLEKVLVAGNTETFLNVTEVFSDGGAAVFEVYCGVTRAAAGVFPFPWWVLLVIPAGVGIGLGVTHSGGGPPPVLSPVVPG
jgi:hypothetical protein